nr:MAG TPA: minor tail protein [Caudoviricetes sp.]
MANLDLGTLVAKIKVEGANTAKDILKGVSSAMGQTSTSSQQAQGGMDSFIGAITSGLGNVNLFGTNLGTLATAFGSSEVASIAMGTALGGVCTAGILAAVSALKGLVSACVDFVANSYDVGVTFQAQMSKVGAISGANAKELDVLTKAARQFGKDSVFSATQAAEALEYTALAGYTVEESITSLPGILGLAAASGIDLGRASDIVTDSISGFNLKVEDSTRLADAMAYTMSHTNTNTEQLGEAYKNCAATCTSVGMSMEETSAWIGELSNNAVKGGEAGTALNAMLGRMYGESEQCEKALQQYGLSMYDSTGKAKNFTTVVKEMQEKMAGLSDEQQNVFAKQVAGINHLSDFNIIMKASIDEVGSLTNELRNCGGAAEQMAKKMTDNIAGLQEAISGKLENIQLSLFTAFEPLATGVLQVVDTVLGAFDTIVEPLGNVVGAILGIFSPIFDGFSRIGECITELIGNFLTPLGELISNIGSLIGSVVGVVVDIVVSAVETVVQFISPIVDIIGTIITAIVQIGTAIGNMMSSYLQPAFNVINEFIEGVKEGILLIPNLVLTGVNKCIEGLNMIPGVAIEQVDYLTENYADAMKTMGDDTADFVGSATDEMESYSSEIDEITQTCSGNFEEMYNAIMQLDSETYGQLQENAEGYMNEYQTYMNAIEEFEKDKSREMVKNWEERNKEKAGTLDYYIEKAEYQASVEEALANRTKKEKEKIEEKYTDKVETELKKQKTMYEQYNGANYDNDYKEFAANEEKKTQKYQEELKKRNGKSGGSSFISGILGGFANGTLSVPKTGVYRVGEFGPETVILPKGAQVHQGNTTSNSNVFNVTIDAKNVHEFNDIVNMCKGYQMTSRMGAV